MITGNFTGNFGDHVREYCLVRCIAEKNGYEFGFNPVPEYDYLFGHEQMNFLDIDYGHMHTATYDEMPYGITSEAHETQIPTPGHGKFYNYHPYCPELFDIPDNTKVVMSCAQDFRYFHPYKSKIKSWLKMKPSYQKIYEETLKNYNFDLNDDLCVLNARGGEYLGIPAFSLTPAYWANAVDNMLQRNPKMKFVCITDDIEYYKNWFSFPVMHFGIGCDYYIINHAKNLILSNSGFAMFPAWLNDNDPFTIAPLYWARHNISDGYWAYSEISIHEWNYMDRQGNLSKL